MTLPGDKAVYKVTQEITIGQTASRRAGAQLSPVLNDPMPNELQTWQTLWLHDQERLAGMPRVADNPLRVSDAGEFLVFGGDPDRDCVPLAALIAQAAKGPGPRPVLIANLAGGTTPASLQAALRSFSPANCIVTSAGAGSTVPELFGPPTAVVATVLGLVSATADEKIRRQLETTAAAIREELEISARPVTVLSALLDDAAGIPYETRTSATTSGVSSDALQAAVDTVRATFSKQRENSDLGDLADLVRPLCRFEGRAPLAGQPAALRILNFDEDSAAPAERARGRAILAGYLQRRLASPHPGVVIVIDAGKLDRALWRVASGPGPGTLLVTMYQEFSGQGYEAASAQVPFMTFFRLAGQDAVAAGQYFGTDEKWIRTSQSTHHTITAQDSTGTSIGVSLRPGINSSETHGTAEGAGNSTTEQLTERDRIHPREFMDLADGEFVFFERRGDGQRYTTGQLPAGGAR